MLDDLATLNVNSGKNLAVNVVLRNGGITGLVDSLYGNGTPNSLYGSVVGDLGGTQGIIGNSGSYNAAVDLVGQQATTFSGNIVDGINGGTGKTQLIRNGGGVLTLGALTTNNSQANNNTFTGGVVLNVGGSISVQNPYALGGYAGTTPGPVLINGGGLALVANTTEIDSPVIYGNPALANGGINVTVTNGGTIASSETTNGTGDYMTINNLTLGNSMLGLTFANADRFRVAGTTTLGGNAAVINIGTAVGSSGELAGQITDFSGGVRRLRPQQGRQRLQQPLDPLQRQYDRQRPEQQLQRRHQRAGRRAAGQRHHRLAPGLRGGQRLPGPGPAHRRHRQPRQLDGQRLRARQRGQRVQLCRPQPIQLGHPRPRQQF